MEPNVEKKRKRRRSLRAYANLNKPIIPETEELINQFPPYAPDDDDAVSEAAEPKPRARRTAKPEVEKRDYSAAERRKLASEGKALPSGAYPIVDQEDLENAAHLARTGHGDVEAARRLIARRSRELGLRNPLEDSAEKGSFVDPMNQPGPIAQALAHHNMRYGTTNPVPLFTQRTEADMFPADLRGMASGVPVALARLNAAAASGLASAPGNPVSRPADHIAPTGTGSNGGHSLADPVSHGSTALKASEARAVLKRYMFGGNGAR